MNRNLPPKVTASQQEPASLDYSYTAWRENFILTILRIASILGIALLVISFQSAPIRDRIVFPILVAILLGVTFLPASYKVRSYTLLAINFVVGINGIITLGTYSDASIFLLIVIVLASLLLDSTENIIIFAVTLAVLITFTLLNLTGVFVPVSNVIPVLTPADWLIFIADFTIMGIIAIVAVQQLRQEFGSVVQRMQAQFTALTAERSKMENTIRTQVDALENKTFQIQASAGVNRSISAFENIPDLLAASAAATSEQFGFYHVGIYLLDNSKKVAFLQASSSDIGKDLIGLGNRIDIDTRNPINIAIEKKRIYTTSDIGGALFIKDPNFPITRSRMAIPLAVRGNLIGVLDIHSDQVLSLTNQDTEIFQTLADLIAISIDNVRLMDETQTLLAQLQFYNSAQAIETWSAQTSRRSPAYQYTPAGVRPIFSQVKKDEITRNVLTIPLTLQGQKIGAIKLRRKGFSAAWSEKEKNMIEKVGEQISLALENSRLVEEAQRSAHRDQLIANISTRVRETLDVEAVIRTASMELRKVFDLKEAEISVGLPQSEPRPVRKNTSTLRLK